MQLGIFAKTFPGITPGEVLCAARNAGYETVQYNMACSGLPSLPETIAPPVIDAVSSATRVSGVSIAALSATYNMIHPDLTVREAGRRAFAALAAAAPAMGTRLLTVCTGSRDAADQWRHHPENASPGAWQDLVAEFRHLLPVAERHGIVIGVEPELGNVVSSAAKARALLDLFASDRIGIVLDPANLFEAEPEQERERRIREAIALLGPEIVLAHAKDRHPDGSFATAGDGVVDFPRFIADLRSAGFDGPLVTHGLDAKDAARVSAFLRASGAAAA
ncbi:sugar phosphate isomerase/epimerase [Kaistia geumhonensis]|uniref:Sugar phosphate isomerase/epimerase n=1 Tax=Kaistia geumhonensis TaxID=410839 RepID=A0ABU0M1D1_9HYPH|nr:sugar phosphate isomerase/epimerase [Kaistia geumhonensis]MCX5480024.1 sugar phosphate isomerase/epimerase [Kaistia geumhonensis]MDQ0514748.1 sugar phosphate isomerase/epimerase [Kaistia geumhonensis]